MDELDILPPILTISMPAAYRQYLRNKRKRRACWKKQWILRRQKHGAHNALMAEFSREYHESYRNFVRLLKKLYFKHVLFCFNMNQWVMNYN